MSALFFFFQGHKHFSGAPESHSPSGRQAVAWGGGWGKLSIWRFLVWIPARRKPAGEEDGDTPSSLCCTVFPFSWRAFEQSPLLLQQTVLKNVFALGSSHWQIPDKLWEKPNKWVETCNKCFLTGHGLHWMDWYVKKIENNLNKMLSLHSPELNPSDLQWEWGVRWCSPQQTREYLF